MLQLVLGTGLTAAALPLSAARGAVQRVGLISDLNSSYGSTRYIPAVHQGLDQLIGLQPDLVVCAGDMVAGQMRGLTGQQLDAMWRGFETSVLQRLQAAKIPLLPAIGNHDGSPGFPADRCGSVLDPDPFTDGIGICGCLAVPVSLLGAAGRDLLAGLGCQLSPCS